MIEEFPRLVVLMTTDQIFKELRLIARLVDVDYFYALELDDEFRFLELLEELERRVK